MYEVYADQYEKISKTIYFANKKVVPEGGVVGYEIHDGEEIVDAGSVEQADDRYEVLLPPTVAGQLLIKWDYVVDGNQVQETERINIVRPYVRLSDVYDYHPKMVDRTIEEVKDMERRVRYIIETFCGQDFHIHPDHQVVAYGQNSDVLHLPKRIIRLKGATAHLRYVAGVLRVPPGGGWAVRYDGPYGINYRDIKADVGPGMGVQSASPYFRSGILYTIFGDFGWESVPLMVNQAARLLISDYFDLEALWRAKNIDVIRAADWRMEYATPPITTTGNVDVDLMLQNYTAPRVAIL